MAKALYNGEYKLFSYKTNYDLQDFIRNNEELQDASLYEVLKLMIECYKYIIYESYLPEENFNS